MDLCGVGVFFFRAKSVGAYGGDVCLTFSARPSRAVVDGRISSGVSNAAYWPLRRHHPVVPMGTRVYRRGAGSLGNTRASPREESVLRCTAAATLAAKWLHLHRHVRLLIFY